MSNDEGISGREAEGTDTAPEAKPVPLTPGRSQRQRSKLRQVPESNPPLPSAPVTPPPPPSQERSDEQLLRRMRLKRSGQMREDLLRPSDPAPKKPDDLY